MAEGERDGGGATSSPRRRRPEVMLTSPSVDGKKVTSLVPAAAPFPSDDSGIGESTTETGEDDSFELVDAASCPSVHDVEVEEERIRRISSWSCCMNARACPGTRYAPTPVEHVANTLSHGVGILTSLGYFWYMLQASHRDLQFYIVLIYGICTTFLFLMSTTYHYFEMMYRDDARKPTIRYYLHITDRTSIYLFIAASYTPWLTLRHCGLPGINAKLLTWTFALAGMAYQCTFHEKYKRVELAIYILVATSPALAVLTMNDWSGLEWMAVGGVVYLVGVVFFKLDGVVPFAHAIWHLHVLAASCIHLHTVLTTLLGPERNNPFPAGVEG